MPPLYRPSPVIGKRPPLVLPRGLGSAIDLNDDGWPKCLAFPEGAGLFDVLCLYLHGSDAANDVGGDLTTP